MSEVQEEQRKWMSRREVWSAATMVGGAAISVIASYIPLLMFTLPEGWLFGVNLGIATLGIALTTALSRRVITASLTIGADGCLVNEEFVSWADVLGVEQEPEGMALIAHGREKQMFSFKDEERVHRAMLSALQTYQQAASPPELEPLRVRVETDAERAARLEQLILGAGYRDRDQRSVDAATLEALIKNPRTEPRTRSEAIEVLSRLAPERLELLESYLDDRFLANR